MPARTRLRRAGMLCRPSWQAVSATLQSRSNQIRNNSGQGVVAGTPGTPATNWGFADPFAGLARTIVATQTINGIEYMGIRYAGTTSATSAVGTFDSSTAIAAAVGQTWAISVFMWVTINSGSTPTFILRMSERDGAGAGLGQQDSGFLSVTSMPTRFSSSAALANASTAFNQPGLRIGFANTTAYDFTTWIGNIKLELGAFATSPIRTTNAARTGVHTSVGR